MGMLDTKKLRLLFRIKLREIQDIPTDIAYENRPFEVPEPDKLWVRETLLIATEIRSSSGLIQTVGETRYDVFGAKDAGTEKVEELAKKIAEKFEAGTSMVTSDGEVDVHVYRAARFPGRVDEAWFFVPVVLSWRTFTPVAVS